MTDFSAENTPEEIRRIGGVHERDRVDDVARVLNEVLGSVGDACELLERVMCSDLPEVAGVDDLAGLARTLAQAQVQARVALDAAETVSWDEVRTN